LAVAVKGPFPAWRGEKDTEGTEEYTESMEEEVTAEEHEGDEEHEGEKGTG
jgi:hypothetical protein